MSYPHPYPPPPGYQSLPPPRKPISSADVVVTSILSVTLLALAVVAFFFASLVGLVTIDVCDTTKICKDHLITVAYVVEWGGLVASLLVPLIGVPVSAVKRTMMWVWPTIGIVLLVATTVGGALVLGHADVQV